MRRRWRWQWRVPPRQLLSECAFGWLLLGWTPGLVLSGLEGWHRHTAARYWALGVSWAGPFVLAALGGVLRGIVLLCRNPPLRRVWESVEDLREQARISD